RELGIGYYPFDFRGIAFDGIMAQDTQVKPCPDLLQALRRQLQAANGAVIREPLVENAKLPLGKDKPLTTSLLEKEPNVRPEFRVPKEPIQSVDKHFVSHLDASSFFRRQPGNQVCSDPLGNTLIQPDFSFRLPTQKKHFLAAHAIKMRLQALQLT